jgi:hypothetical protein
LLTASRWSSEAGRGEVMTQRVGGWVCGLCRGADGGGGGLAGPRLGAALGAARTEALVPRVRGGDRAQHQLALHGVPGAGGLCSVCFGIVCRTTVGEVKRAPVQRRGVAGGAGRGGGGCCPGCLLLRPALPGGGLEGRRPQASLPEVPARHGAARRDGSAVHAGVRLGGGHHGAGPEPVSGGRFHILWGRFDWDLLICRVFWS